MVLLLAEGGELVGRAMAGEVGASVLGLKVPVEDTVVGHVFRTGRTERLSEMRSQVRFRLGEYVHASAGLIVPLVFRSRRIGVLAAFDRLTDGPEFGKEDGRLIEAFAAAAATAVAGAQDVAAQTLQRSIEASEGERARWARELHDETLQELGGLKLALGAAARLDDLEAVRAAIAAAAEQVGSGITQLRHLITELRPASLDELGTGPALEALVERTAVVNGLEVSLELDLDYESGRESSRHAPAVETTIYRLVQEALTNAVKHAKATRVKVVVVEQPESIDITVSDDGVGFDPEQGVEGFGLIGMRERASLMDGTLSVVSQPELGTTIRCRIPGQRASQPVAAARRLAS
jgi:signal transduction histidine kinase